MKHALLCLLVLVLVSDGALAQRKPAPAPATSPPPLPAAKSSAPVGNMKPGLWEITTVNETAGSTTKRTVTSRACYAAADVASIGRVVPQQREFGMKCETRDAKQQGFDATWRVVCSGKDSTMNGVGKMTLGPESFSGRAELELKATSAKPVKVEQKVSGAWMGLCK